MRWCAPLAEPLELIANEGERLLALAREDPQRPVNQYPEWTMSDLLAHTGSILGRTTAVCRDRIQERPKSPRMDEGEEALGWFEGRISEMIEVLQTSDLDVPVWGFGPNPSIGFWIRRMLIEVGLHRWDAEQSFGRPIPLLDEVAVAGLDEFPEMWLPRLGQVPTIELEANDLGRKWIYGSGDPVHTIIGSGSDEYLRLMSRPSPISLPESWEDAVGSLAPAPR